MRASAAQPGGRFFAIAAWRWIGWLVTAAVLCAVGAVILRSGGELSQCTWRIDPLRAMGALAIVTGSYPLFALAWRQALAASGGSLSGRSAVRIYARSQLARYLPGSLWNYIGRTMLCAREGIDRSAAVGSMVLENAAMVVSALLVFAATLPLWPTTLDRALQPMLIVGAVVMLLLFHPAVFARIVRLAARVTLSPVPTVDLSMRRLWAVGASYIAAWCVLGAGFWAFAASVHPLPLSSLPVLVGGGALAWTVGFLALVPCGLGVREAMAVAVLAMLVPAPVAAVIAVGFRLVQVVGELIWAAVAAGLHAPTQTQGA